MTILLNNVSTNQTSAEFESKGGSAIVNIRGDDFGGATVLIQMASDQDTLDRFITLPNGSFIVDTSIKIDYLPQGVKLRVDLIDTGGSTSNIFCDIL